MWLWLLTTAHAATWTVGPTGTFGTIAEALAVAADGDTLVLEVADHPVSSVLNDRVLTIQGAPWSVAPGPLPPAGTWPRLVPIAPTDVPLQALEGELTLQGLEIETGVASGLATVDTNLTLTDVRFSGTGAPTLDGAAIWMAGGTSVLSGVQIDDMVGRDGIVRAAFATLTLQNVTATGNAVHGDGGVLHLVDANTTWTGGSATNNGTVGPAPSRGGVVYADGGTLQIDSVDLLSSFATDGGAVASVDADVSLMGVLLDNSLVSGDGGALWASGGTLALDQVVATTNQADRGAVAWVQDAGVLTDSLGSHSDNIATLHGGVFAAFDSTADLQQTHLQDNQAGGAGAGVWGSGSGLALGQATLTGQSSLGDGAGIWASGGLINLDEVLASGNVAGTLGKAATASDGGVLWAGNALASVVGLDAVGNEASAQGGALYLTDLPAGSQLTALGLLENTAMDGGAIAVEGGDTILGQLTAFGNVSTRQGAHLWLNGSVELINALVDSGTGNVAVFGGPSASVVRRHVAVTHNGPRWGGTLGLANPGEVLIATQCAVRLWTPNALIDDDLRLLGGSPCLDAGWPTWLDDDGSVSDIGRWGGPGLFLPDVDNDGAAAHVDCDDNDAAVGAGTAEGLAEAYDGIDQDCDGSDLVDVDGDGAIATEAGGPDCVDTDPTINPNFAEIWYDGIDQDCDGLSDFDADQDGHDSLAFGGDDCDDFRDHVNPSAVDLPYDGLDGNCDGSLEGEFDADGDGVDALDHGGTDCADLNPFVFPGAPEIPYDGIDQDCSGSDANDLDGDGFAGGLTPNAEDCDDTNPSVNPASTEIWYDNIDQNCDGNDADQDGDGAISQDEGGDDCDDRDPLVGPQAEEIWYDGIDQNCDGLPDDDQDGDGFPVDEDCDDTRAAIFPGAVERDNDLDDDCDGLTEDADPDKDGLTDWEEGLLGTDPALPDTDGDGQTDLAEVIDVDRPTDHDGDGIHDALDDDDDGDGIPSLVEATVDVDGDGRPDLDIDGDGRRNDRDRDSDADGYLDADEGTADADRDGIPDFADAQGALAGGGGGRGCQGGRAMAWWAFGLPWLLWGGRRRRLHAAAAVAATVGVSASTPAAAQEGGVPTAGGLNVHGHHVVGTRGDLMSQTRLLTPTKRRAYGVGLVYDYTHRPLMEVTPSGAEPVVSSMMAGTVVVDLRPLKGLAIGAAVPLGIGFSPAGQFLGLGDSRLDLAWTPLAPKGAAPGLAIAAHGFLPSGNSGLSFGSERPSVAGTVALNEVIGRFGLTLNLGARWAPQPTIARNITANLGPWAGLGVAVRATDWLAVNAMVTAQGLTGFERPPVEAHGGLRFAMPAGLWAEVGAGAGLTDGIGAPIVRATANLGWAWSPDGKETFVAIAAPPKPEKPGTSPADAEGAPQPFRASETVLDAADLLEDVELPEPAPDVQFADEDIDVTTELPDGTPETANDVRFSGEGGGTDDAAERAALADLILQPLRFDLDSTVVRGTDRSRLDSIGSLLRSQRDLKVVIVGHTDLSGGVAYNDDLAFSRAVSVKRALVAAGVKGRRITCEGAGASEPLVPHTAPNHALNRRVEIRLVLPPESR